MQTNSAIRLVSKNLVINIAGALWQFLLVIVGTKIVLTQLGADSFGILALVGGTVGYFIYLDIGIAETVVKKVSDAPSPEHISRVVSTLFFFCLGFGALLALMVALFAYLGVPLIFSFAPPLMQSAVSVFLVIAAGLWILYPINMFSKVFVGLHRFDIYNVLRVIFQTVILIGIVIVLKFHNSAEAAIAVITVGGILWKLAAWALLRKLYPDIRIARDMYDPKLLRELLHYQSYATVGQAFGHGLNQCDLYMIGMLLGPGYIAIYSVANILALKVCEFAGVFGTTIFPLLSGFSGGNRHEDVRKGMVLSIHAMLLILIPVTAFLFYFSPHILRLWVGSDYADATPALQGLAIARFIPAVTLMAMMTYNATGRPNVSAAFNGCILIANLALDYLLITQYGFIGAVYGTLICQVGAALAMMLMVPRSFNVPKDAFILAIVKTVFIGAATSAVYLLPIPSSLFVVPPILHALSFYALYYFFAVDEENRFYIRNIATLVLGRKEAP